MERARYKGESDDPYNSQWGDIDGAYLIRIDSKDRRGLKIIATIGDAEYPWEHVSVSREDRCPTWEEMCFVKDIFWREDECVVQFHPPKSAYVNRHLRCLHLWKWKEGAFPQPDSVLVGPKDEKELLTMKAEQV